MIEIRVKVKPQVAYASASGPCLWASYKDRQREVQVYIVKENIP